MQLIARSVWMGHLCDVTAEDPGDCHGNGGLQHLGCSRRPFTLVITAFVRSSWAQAASASLALWQGSRVIGLAVFGPPFALVAEMLSVLCQSCWPPLQVPCQRKAVIFYIELLLPLENDAGLLSCAL